MEQWAHDLGLDNFYSIYKNRYLGCIIIGLRGNVLNFNVSFCKCTSHQALPTAGTTMNMHTNCECHAVGDTDTQIICEPRSNRKDESADMSFEFNSNSTTGKYKHKNEGWLTTVCKDICECNHRVRLSYLSTKCAFCYAIRNTIQPSWLDAHNTDTLVEGLPQTLHMTGSSQYLLLHWENGEHIPHICSAIINHYNVM